MKRATTILTCVLAAGVAVAQNPSIIQNTKAIMQGVQANETRATNQAVGISSSSAQAAPKPVVKPSASTPSVAPKAVAVKPAVVATKTSAAPKVAPAVAVKTATPKPAPKAGKLVPVVANTASKPAAAAPSGATPEPAKSAEEKKWPMTGKRDPFVSPVVYQTGASNCTGGKKCLEIGAINLKGVVRSDNGFIAVVTNSMNKAYFLRENDPVFDGYVVKITGDSIVFQETLQDRLGKTFTKEVVKKLTTPAV
jgi:hypothetical protein